MQNLDLSGTHLVQGIELLGKLHFGFYHGLHLSGEVVHLPTVNFLQNLTLVGQLIHSRSAVFLYLKPDQTQLCKTVQYIVLIGTFECVAR